MSCFGLKSHSEAFFGVCVLTTGILVSWCIWEYSVDHDFTEMKFTKFHQNLDDIYPSITICDKKPFMKSKVLQLMTNLPINHPKYTDVDTDLNLAWVYKSYLAGNEVSIQQSSYMHEGLNNSYEDLLRALQSVFFSNVPNSHRLDMYR